MVGSTSEVGSSRGSGRASGSGSSSFVSSSDSSTSTSSSSSSRIETVTTFSHIDVMKYIEKRSLLTVDPNVSKEKQIKRCLDFLSKLGLLIRKVKLNNNNVKGKEESDSQLLELSPSQEEEEEENHNDNLDLYYIPGLTLESVLKKAFKNLRIIKLKNP